MSAYRARREAEGGSCPQVLKGQVEKVRTQQVGRDVRGVGWAAGNTVQRAEVPCLRFALGLGSYWRGSHAAEIRRSKTLDCVEAVGQSLVRKRAKRQRTQTYSGRGRGIKNLDMGRVASRSGAPSPGSGKRGSPRGGGGLQHSGQAQPGIQHKLGSCLTCSGPFCTYLQQQHHFPLLTLRHYQYTLHYSLQHAGTTAGKAARARSFCSPVFSYCLAHSASRTA